MKINVENRVGVGDKEKPIRHDHDIINWKKKKKTISTKIAVFNI